jgi:hypothetical protein
MTPAPHKSRRFLYACASCEAIKVAVIVSISDDREITT